MSSVPASPLNSPDSNAESEATSRPTPVLVRARSVDATHEFSSEHDGDAHHDQPAGGSLDPRPRSPWLVPAIAAGTVAVLATLAIVAGVPGIGGAAGPAHLAVETSPPGARVILGGVDRGATPLSIDVPPGPVSLVVRSADDQRAIDLTLRGGETVRHYIEFAPRPVAAPTGTLEVTSDPPGVTLLIDGVPAGPTPLSPTTLPIGVHVLTTRFQGGAVEQRVDIQPGRTESVHVINRPNTANAAGWLNVVSPVAFRILEDGKLLGTTDVDRVMLQVGKHNLRFVSDETGFEVTREVDVVAGRAAAISIDVPTSTLSVNASPWAEVFVDGRPVGETPLGNLVLPIGRHDVVLRHPELGERRQVATLTTRGPLRVSVDFRAR